MKLLNQANRAKNDTFSTLKVNKLALRLTKIWPKTIGSELCLTLCLLTFLETAIAQDKNLSPLPAKLAIHSTLNVSLQKNQLSIHAKQVPWQTLLTKLAEKTQIQIKSAKPKDGTVTASIPAMPVNQALQQLLNRHFDYVLLFNNAEADIAIPEAVWLLNNISNSEPASNRDIENKQAPVKSAAKKADTGKNERNVEKKMQALADLSSSGQTNITAKTGAIETALKDKDARVREYAIQALASLDIPEITDYLRQALDDPDAGVRIRAMESIAPDAEGIPLLKEALRNSDETVQAMAEERLSQLEQ